MSSSSELSSFAARLRRFIRASTSALAADMLAFDQFALELFTLQFEHNAPYRRLCEARGAGPDTVGHWTGIPAAPTSAFKEFELSCLPVTERTTVFHSSGTTGQRPSRHFHNAASLALYEASLLAWFEAHFRMANGKWQMAILTPPPAQAPHSSLVHMFQTIGRELGSGSSPFVGRVAGDGGWALDLEAALERLTAASASGRPMLILGTAFSFVHLLDHLAARKLRFEFPPSSCAMETGGYKGRSRSLPKAALHGHISQRLGISPDHIICEYGMSELSSQAYDNAAGPSRITSTLRSAVHPPQYCPPSAVLSTLRSTVHPPQYCPPSAVLSTLRSTATEDGLRRTGYGGRATEDGLRRTGITHHASSISLPGCGCRSFRQRPGAKSARARLV
jgi:hypothetical protein